MDNIIKTVSAFILAIVVVINAFGNFIGIGDIIPTEPATTVTETTVPATPSDPETTVASAMTKAEFVAFLNAETAKAAKGVYDYNRYSGYTSPVDVGGATDILNSIIGSISDGKDNLDSVVGSFIGIGTIAGTFPTDYLRDIYQLKGTNLTVADIQDFSYADGVYSFTLADATNPQKDNQTPISRFTNDFLTHQEVDEGIKYSAGDAIKLIDSNVKYDNIRVDVKVEDGKLANIKYSYAYDATLVIKVAVVKVNGTGAAVTYAEFSNFIY